MARHRFLEQLAGLQGRQTSAPSLSGFVPCPAALTAAYAGQQCPWQGIYELAYARAREVVRPSRLDRFHANLQN